MFPLTTTETWICKQTYEEMSSQEMSSPKVIWSSEAIHRLLECARDFPMLWDPAHELFSKTLLKKSTWSNIAKQLQLEFPELAAGNLNAGK